MAAVHPFIHEESDRNTNLPLIATAICQCLSACMCMCTGMCERLSLGRTWFAGMVSVQEKKKKKKTFALLVKQTHSVKIKSESDREVVMSASVLGRQGGDCD